MCICKYRGHTPTSYAYMHVCSQYPYNPTLCPLALFLSVSSKDQDKTRPLSTLANLAIIITDVQDMDPIFINLPYSTNIYEHSPPVSPARSPSAVLSLPLVPVRDSGDPRHFVHYTIFHLSDAPWKVPWDRELRMTDHRGTDS